MVIDSHSDSERLVATVRSSLIIVRLSSNLLLRMFLILLDISRQTDDALRLCVAGS